MNKRAGIPIRLETFKELQKRKKTEEIQKESQVTWDDYLLRKTEV